MTTYGDLYTGYFLTMGSKAVFLKSSAARKTKKVTEAMIDAIANYRGFCPELRDRIKADDPTCKRIQHDMEPASLQEKETDGKKWYSVSGKYFGGGYDPEEIIIA